MPKQIIRWTLEESQLVAQEAARIRHEQHKGELECWRQAQRILPESRRRQLLTVSLLAPAAREYYHRLVQELNKQSRVNTVIEQAVAPQEISGATTIDDLIEQLADAVADKFVVALRRSIQQQMQDLPQVLEQIRTAPQTSRTLRKPVLVVGLLPSQAETIKKRFNDRMDLRFVSSQEPPQQISAKVGGAEKILLMTNFINHSHQQAAVNAKGRENVLLVSGGVSSLSKRLESL